MQINEFLQRLQSVKGNGTQYTAKCPAHDDKRASLSIAAGEDGRILVNCHAGCSSEAICSALGLTLKDLYAEPLQKPPQTGCKPQIVATYNYTDENGKLLAQKQRRADKTFIWRRPDGSGGWKYDRKGVKPMLYHTTEAVKADSVFLVEGEKDADTMKRLGKAAVSPPDGAGGKWKENYTQTLKDKHVIIIADNDAPGRKFAIETAGILSGEAKTVKVLDLTKIWPELPEHGDTTDIIEHFGDVEGMDKIERLATETEEFLLKEPKTIKPTLVKASEVPYEPPKWMIPPYFQRGKGTLIQADSGVGKTAFMCAIAAHVSTGRPLLEIPIETPGNVLILSVEDDLPVLRGRIEASDGDLDKCHFITNAAGLTFNSPEVEQAIAQVNAKLVIFDPFQAFLGSRIDMFKANQTRPELAKLFEMCERQDCSCAIVAHTGKSKFEKSPVNMSLGSVDIPAAMRSVLQIIRNPDDEKECIVIHVKCSNAPKGKSIAYTIGDRGGVNWGGFSDVMADDLKVIASRKEREKSGIPYENEPLVQVFNQLITDRPGGGFWSYSELKAEGAKILGFPPYISVNDLRNTLDNGLARELQKRDGLIVTHGEKGRANTHGIRIQQFQLPRGYQTKINGG